MDLATSKVLPLAARTASIAAASVLAKVTRDRMMLDYDKLYPGYGFAVHKGYGTPQHLAALRALGPCPIHRRSFAPLKEKERELELFRQGFPQRMRADSNPRLGA